MVSSIANDYASTSEKMAKSLAKYKITLAEFVFDASFIVNFIVGKLIHVFSQEEEIYNYYNNKGNIVNQWFVKKGWGWTTLVILLFYVVHLSKASRDRTKIVTGALVRWAAATFWWVLFTQWCFGLPIMDKVFVYTGGKCASIPSHKMAALSELGGAISRQFYLVGDQYESVSVSSYRCRSLKGSWEGGHDPSGHVFLLVHASLYMFHEIRVFWPGWTEIYTQVNGFGASGQFSLTERIKRLVASAPHVPVLLLLALWWFMLLVTNMYFHSLAEKLVGLVFGYLGVVAVYYVPRYVMGGEEKMDSKGQ